MGNNDLCVCGSGEKQKRCHPDLDPRSIVANVWRRLVMLDEKVETLKIQNDVTFFCKIGCHACCDEYFYVSEVEYYLIKNHMLSKSPKSFSRATQKAQMQYQKFEQKYPKELLKLQSCDSNIDLFDDKKYLKRFELCPFVNDETGLCDAYYARPIICRLYGTSYCYSYCDDIRKKVKGIFGFRREALTKGMVGIPYDMSLRDEIDFFHYPNNLLFLPRAYPVFYWLAIDDLNAKEYQFATTRPQKEYLSFLTNGVKPG